MKLNELNEKELKQVEEMWATDKWKDDYVSLEDFVNVALGRCEYCGDIVYKDELSNTVWEEEGKIILVCEVCESDIRRENNRYYENQNDCPIDGIIEEKWIEEGR